MSTVDIRQNPDEDFIERIRLKYEVERTVDKALTRKMRLRGGSKYMPVDATRFEQQLLGFLKKTNRG